MSVAPRPGAHDILSAAIVASAPGRAAFPEASLPEVAFLGRSNVGKSSLLNRLAGRRGLARTSATPGKTRLIHFFDLERRDGVRLRFVDLPGYGYARVSQREREGWGRLVEGYLAERENLRLAVLLQDARRDASDDERNLLAWLAEQGVASACVATKADKLKPSVRTRRLRDLARQLECGEEGLVVTSALRGEGLPALWALIDQQLPV